MVDITIGAIPPVHNNQGNGNSPRRQAPPKKTARNRRKNKEDRRRSVRNGVVVTLSDEGHQFVEYTERRRQTDRRKSGS